MQLMTWTVARLGSRFSLLFEPHHGRVRHSALGRFLDRPMDLMVGLIEPDGTERVLPFTQRGELLSNCEQFERFNSITYRGFSEKYQLRFEFNIHSVFYPRDEALCTMPAFYLEMRVYPSRRVRLHEPSGETPKRVTLFLRLRRDETEISASAQGKSAQIDLAYRATLVPDTREDPTLPLPVDEHGSVPVRERIVSLNEGCEIDDDGMGLKLELPVTEQDKGIKWRLVWGAHCAEPILTVNQNGDGTRRARLRYTSKLPDIDAVIADAVEHRDDRLIHSRRLERLLDEASLTMTQRHLINQSAQSFLANTFWCVFDDGQDWFSVWEGSSLFQSTLDVEYNVALWYLTFWPDLLAKQLRQWAHVEHGDEPSGGSFLRHDLGKGVDVTGQAYDHDMPIEENTDYLLLLQAYTHWTGDLLVATELADLIDRLAKYLLWTDRDGSGFPSAGVANTIDDGGAAVQVARKQTYLAVKRVAALAAAADLLELVGWHDVARSYADSAEVDSRKIESAAWLGDHYMVCIDSSAAGVTDARTGEQLAVEQIPGWDAYSIYTGNGLLLPAMIGRPPVLDPQRLSVDVYTAMRETLRPYGCGHSSFEPENIWISQNLWRDHLGLYLGMDWPPFLAQRYWDMQVMSNTHRQSLGYVDTYINNKLSFYPRGVASVGYLLASPRLVIDRLAPGGERVSIEPTTTLPQRWPLLPLADWPAGRVPVCVVDECGNIRIEGEIDPIIVRGAEDGDLIG